MRAFGIISDFGKARRHFMCYHAHIHCDASVFENSPPAPVTALPRNNNQAVRGRQNSVPNRREHLIFDTDVLYATPGLRQVSKRHGINRSRSKLQSLF